MAYKNPEQAGGAYPGKVLFTATTDHSGGPDVIYVQVHICDTKRLVVEKVDGPKTFYIKSRADNEASQTNKAEYRVKSYQYYSEQLLPPYTPVADNRGITNAVRAGVKWNAKVEDGDPISLSGGQNEITGNPVQGEIIKI